MLLEQERALIAQYGRRMLASGLTRGTGGNLSIADRSRGLAAISPSAVEYESVQPADVPVIDLQGRVVDGYHAPSTELPLHISCYQGRADIGAVVHTHSVFATVLACLGADLPAVHYLIGFAGSSVRCAPYATFGTDRLAQQALAAMGSDNAVLLENHGLLAVGPTIQDAFTTAEMIEFCAEVYCRALGAGTPKIIPDDEMEIVRDKFKKYTGQ